MIDRELYSLIHPFLLLSEFEKKAIGQNAYNFLTKSAGELQFQRSTEEVRGQKFMLK